MKRLNPIFCLMAIAGTMGISGYLEAANPSFVWNTFVGGTGDEEGTSLAVDQQENLYLAGSSMVAWGTPIRAFSGGQDAFVAKLDGQGNLLWSTFLGGAGTDRATGIAVDGQGNVFVGGESNAAWGTPVDPYEELTDFFVAKLNPAGQLQWLTFSGGTGSQRGPKLSLAPDGGIYVAGLAETSGWGPQIIPYNGNGDGYVGKFDQAGHVLWSTCLGSTDWDSCSAIWADKANAVYVTGISSYSSWGTPIRAFTGDYDAFAAKLDSSGNLVWNTFLGGADQDFGNAIVVNPAGDIYVGGATQNVSWGAPLHPYTYGWDIFLAKLANQGGMLWNTFLGEVGDDDCKALSLNPAGGVYFVGVSTDTWGSPLWPYSSGNDVVVAKINSAGTLQWNFFLGGNGDETGAALTVDLQGLLYAAGESTVAWGTPVHNDSGGIEAWAVKVLDPDAMPTATASPTPTSTPGQTLNTYGRWFYISNPVFRPGQSQLRLALTLGQAGSVRVEVFGISGRRAAFLADRVFPAGTTWLEWDGANAGSGLYVVRAMGPGEEVKNKITVIR